MNRLNNTTGSIWIRLISEGSVFPYYVDALFYQNVIGIDCTVKRRRIHESIMSVKRRDDRRLASCGLPSDDKR